MARKKKNTVYRDEIDEVDEVDEVDERVRREYLLVKAEMELRRNHVAPGLVGVVLEKMKRELDKGGGSA